MKINNKSKCSICTRIRIFSKGFYLSLILWVCGMATSIMVENRTIKLLLIFIPLAIYEFFAIGRAVIENKVNQTR